MGGVMRTPGIPWLTAPADGIYDPYAAPLGEWRALRAGGRMRRGKPPPLAPGAKRELERLAVERAAEQDVLYAEEIRQIRICFNVEIHKLSDEGPS